MKYVLVGSACLVLILGFIFASSYYKGQQAEKFGFMAQKNAELFVRKHSPTLGSPDAKVYVVEFMDRQGHEIGEGAPVSIADIRENLDSFHVIVSLEGDPRGHIEIPFHTVLQVWDVGQPSTGPDGSTAEYLDMYRDIAGRVEDLMVTMRGEDAD